MATIGVPKVRVRRISLGSRDSQTRIFLRAFSRDRFATVAAIILAVFLLMIIAAPVIAPYDPIRGEPALRLQGPSMQHWFGVDSQGRDILSRLLWGGRVSIPLAVTPVIIATMISSGIALIAGYFGRIIANILMRLIDVMFAFPTVILAMTVAAFMGAGRLSVLVAVTIVLLAPMTRVGYIAVREQVGKDFVDAARSLGASHARLMLTHILPNAMGPMLVYASTLVGLMVVFVAGLSFLGLGLSPPTPDWGLMVAEGRQVMGVAFHVATFPGIVIAVVALCFNLIGDGLRFALDPRIRNRGN
ncbi:MAG: ABC transporter permease [Dehalococcoidia bacterium]|nr:ABC transporter permease [Dehalococcoidia bacterium]